MLPGGLDAMYRAALATSHEPFLRIEILDGDRNLLHSINPDEPVYLGGNVTASLVSRVARTCNLTFAEDMYPFEPDGLLAPYGNMIRATRGVRFAEGTTYSWTVFLGRIQEATLTDNGTCQVRASDLATDVIDVRFLTPQNSQAGSSVSSEVRRLISDAVPGAVFGSFDNEEIAVRPLTWQLERGQALDELAQSVSSFWYPLADGSFVLRRYAWTVLAPPVVSYSDGDEGSVTGSSATRSRAGVYNSLTVTGERLNGDEPVYATAQDTNPTSPTFVNGPFGRRHQLARLQTPGSQSAVAQAAENNLKRLVALVDAWDWTMTPDAALELGDVVSLNVRGRTDIIQVVSGFTIPLDLSGPMRVEGRSLVVGALEGVS